jgi:ribosomal-protein-alanine N-acetyltransferase
MTSSEALVTGPRLFLRHPVLDDADEFVTLREASRDFHLAWEPIPEDGSDPISEAGFKRFLATSDTPESQKHLMCSITDDAIVGYVGLSQISMGVFCSAYMGFWVGVEHARRGYATEGISLCLERAFTRLGLHRVEANVIPTNTASLATVHKCGFRKEGYSPRYLKIAGEWSDHERWAITIEEWEASRGPISRT